MNEVIGLVNTWEANMTAQEDVVKRTLPTGEKKQAEDTQVGSRESSISISYGRCNF